MTKKVLHYVVKRGVCYLNKQGENRFSQKRAHPFHTRKEAKDFREKHSNSTRIVTILKRGTLPPKPEAKFKVGDIVRPFDAMYLCVVEAVDYYWHRNEWREGISYTIKGSKGSVGAGNSDLFILLKRAS